MNENLLTANKPLLQPATPWHAAKHNLTFFFLFYFFLVNFLLRTCFYLFIFLSLIKWKIEIVKPNSLK